MGFSVIPLRSRHAPTECNGDGAERHREGCTGLGSKQPAVAWDKYKTERATSEQIHAWWGQNPDYGVGIITGAVSAPDGLSLGVFDFDGPNSFRELLGGLDGVPGHNTLVSQTGRDGGGNHVFVYFSGPTKKTHMHLSGERVDLLTDKSLAAVYPTIHPKSGRRYQWLNRPSHVFSMGKTLPQWLSDIGITLPDRCNVCNTVVEAHTSQDGNEVNEGARHMLAIQKAGSYAARLPAGDVLEAMRDWNAVHCHPPLPDAEIVQMVSDFSKSDAAEERPRIKVTMLAETIFRNREVIAGRFLDPARAMGIRTGFESFDLMTTGLHPSTTTTLAARPGEFKTALGWQMAEQMAGMGTPVAFFSLEMTADQLIQRAIQNRIGITLQQVVKRKQGISRFQLDALNEAFDNYASLPILLDDRSSCSIEYVTEVIAQAASLGIKVVFFDYLQLGTLSGESSWSRTDTVGKIVERAADWAKKCGISLVMLSQLNRDSAKANRAPELYDLKDSSVIEQRSDSVWMNQLQMDDLGTTTGVRTWVKKAKYGERGVYQDFLVRPSQPLKELAKPTYQEEDTMRRNLESRGLIPRGWVSTDPDNSTASVMRALSMPSSLRQPSLPEEDDEGLG
jgi:hypothetical protein